MLIRLLHHLPFDHPRTQRLLCLENKLRRSSNNSMALKDYIEWLEEAKISVPTRRTLNEDLKRYANFCDDIRYGGDSKLLSLDSSARRDAIIWLMGHTWLDSPLCPKLSSACVRCLLLAKELQAEVDFPYNALRKPGEPWKPQTRRGIPVRFIPGSDSGYMQLWLDWGKKININLARIQRYVKFTNNSTSNYVSSKEEHTVYFTIESANRFLLERLQRQFPNFTTVDKHKLILQVEESLAVMLENMLKAHLERTQTSERHIPVKQKVGDAVIHYEKN